jgi:hypothetical protein
MKNGIFLTGVIFLSFGSLLFGAEDKPFGTAERLSFFGNKAVSAGYEAWPKGTLSRLNIAKVAQRAKGLKSLAVFAGLVPVAVASGIVVEVCYYNPASEEDKKSGKSVIVPAVSGGVFLGSSVAAGYFLVRAGKGAHLWNAHRRMMNRFEEPSFNQWNLPADFQKHRPIDWLKKPEQTYTCADKKFTSAEYLTTQYDGKDGVKITKTKLVEYDDQWYK